MGRQGIFIFIAILAIIAGLAMVVFNNKNAAPSTSNNATTTAQPSAPTANLLTISNQKAGNVVSASEADLLQPGFVVIKDGSTASAKTLGASVILSASKNSLVFANAQTVRGKTYYAYLYGDNGDSKFGSGDQILKDSSGNQIIVPFQAL